MHSPGRVTKIDKDEDLKQPKYLNLRCVILSMTFDEMTIYVSSTAIHSCADGWSANR